MKDRNVKSGIQKLEFLIFDDLGLDITTALRMFLKATAKAKTNGEKEALIQRAQQG